MPCFSFETVIAGIKKKGSSLSAGLARGGDSWRAPISATFQKKSPPACWAHDTDLGAPQIHSAFITPDPIGQAGFPTYHFFSENVQQLPRSKNPSQKKTVSLWGYNLKILGVLSSSQFVRYSKIRTKNLHQLISRDVFPKKVPQEAHVFWFSGRELLKKRTPETNNKSIWK